MAAENMYRKVNSGVNKELEERYPLRFVDGIFYTHKREVQLPLGRSKLVRPDSLRLPLGERTFVQLETLARVWVCDTGEAREDLYLDERDPYAKLYSMVKGGRNEEWLIQEAREYYAGPQGTNLWSLSSPHRIAGTIYTQELWNVLKTDKQDAVLSAGLMTNEDDFKGYPARIPR